MTTRQPTVIAALVAATLAGVLLAGCAGTGDETPEAGGSVSASPSSSSSGPSLNPSGRPSVSPLEPSGSVSGGKSGNGEITLTGEIEEGVEAGCMLLRTPDKAYLLLGGDRDLIRSGGRVTVRGRPEPGMMTTCQQGTPFQVIEARRA